MGNLSEADQMSYFLNTYELDELVENEDYADDPMDEDDYDLRELYYPETLP
jgi:hypothetical protein